MSVKPLQHGITCDAPKCDAWDTHPNASSAAALVAFRQLGWKIPDATGFKTYCPYCPIPEDDHHPAFPFLYGYYWAWCATDTGDVTRGWHVVEVAPDSGDTVWVPAIQAFVRRRVFQGHPWSSIEKPPAPQPPTPRDTGEQGDAA